MENKTPQPTDIRVAQLELKHIAKYLSNGLKGILIQDKSELCSEDWADNENDFKKGAIWELCGYAPGDLNIYLGEGVFDGFLWRKGNTYVNFHRGIKPVLRFPDLTKPITHKGETFVPIVELYKMSNESNYNKELDFEFVNSWGAGQILKVWNNREKDDYTEFIFYNSSFRKDRRYGVGSDAFGIELPTPIKVNCKIYNQELLFEKLAEWMFDTKGLIQAGLAVDVETLNTNPYQ